MIARLLPPKEWPRLEGTELGPLVPHLTPVRHAVVVVEDGDRIVACWAALWTVHLEGVWIHPDYRRNVGVVRRLMRRMRALLRDTFGVETAVTSAMTDEVRSFIERLGGTKLPGEHFVIPVRN